MGPNERPEVLLLSVINDPPEWLLKGTERMFTTPADNLGMLFLHL